MDRAILILRCMGPIVSGPEVSQQPTESTYLLITLLMKHHGHLPRLPQNIITIDMIEKSTCATLCCQFGNEGYLKVSFDLVRAPLLHIAV